jgi:Peptide-N-glycosidase F, C terminal
MAHRQYQYQRVLKLIILAACSLGTSMVNAGELRARTAPTVDVVESVWVSMRIKVPTPDQLGDAKGFGLVFIDPGHGSLSEDFVWDEPNTDHSIAIGFDVYNPPPSDIEPDENGRVMGWFDEYGNWYDRPQREVSVHANGRERINVCSKIEYRTGEWMDVAVQLRYILGGAQILVRIDNQTVIDQPIWDVDPMRLHAMVGCEGDSIEIEHLEIIRQQQLERQNVEPVPVKVFDTQELKGAARLRSKVDFGHIPESVGRVIGTLSLTEPEGGFDHWDKKGTVGLSVPGPDGSSERFELVRFITPYRRGWTWHQDLTDLLPLFADERELDIWIETYMKGWDVSFELDFYEGELDKTPYKVVNLWNGNADIGEPDRPVDAFYVPRVIPVDEATVHARVRTTVTGHGMYPNSNNAGEFMPIWRTLNIIGPEVEGQRVNQSARDHLWKTDVYLNPCRPQRGTWKFDRSGWAPGSIVLPWIVDVQDDFVFSDSIRVEYILDDYVNEGRGETWTPHHWTGAVMVLYR